MIYVKKETKGLGYALWCVREHIGNESFIALLGDDIIKSKESGIKHLITIMLMRS